MFAGVFVSGGFLITFGQFVPSWDSSYYGLMMTQNISYRDYLNSKWWLMIIGTAITAVIKPFSGDTPDATAKAIAKGKATIPTIIPAKMSFTTCFLLTPDFKTVKNFDLKTVFIQEIFSEAKGRTIIVSG